MVPLQRAFRDVRYSRVVGVCGTQMGKTDASANVLGERIDDEPAPLIYLGPTRYFVERKWEPRFVAMVDSAPSLSRKMQRGKAESKTQKLFGAGISVTFAWAGSPASMAGDPAALVVVDERDQMEVREGQSDPVELANARVETYADGVVGVFSTPTNGTAKVRKHPETSIEHWEPSEEVTSPIWQLWQQGTRHQWCWPCPDCGEFFAPRFELLVYPRDAGPGGIRDDNVGIACPHCGSIIRETAKNGMNDRGVDLSPGQRVVDGAVVGEGVASDWYSLWVSGLCSPWRSWTASVRRYVRALHEGSSAKIQGVVNTCFGELYSVSGEAPPWQDVAQLRLDYVSGEVPEGAEVLALTVDVQKDRLYYIVRGWSRHRNMESWLIEHGTIEGATNEPDVWEALEQFRIRQWGEAGHKIFRCFVDQKYRTQYVFAFCRKHKNWAFPSAGILPRSAEAEQRPLSSSSIEVNAQGKVMKGGENGVLRWRLNTDFFKRWVHDRVLLGSGGGFHLPRDATDDYCQQVVSEARVVTDSGRLAWIKTQRDNHYLDCEGMQVACAYSLRLHHYAQPIAEASAGDEATPKKPPPPAGPPRNWTTTW